MARTIAAEDAKYGASQGAVDALAREFYRLMTQRLFEAVLAGCLPLTPASIRDAARFTPADLHITDLTAAARGAARLFPGTRTILDVGGQTMKASRLTDAGAVKSFRLNDNAVVEHGAAGAPAFDKVPSNVAGWGENRFRAAVGLLPL